MKKLFRLAVLILTLPALAGAFKLPKIALGPYVGAYLMDCTTINNQVLCISGDPSLGAAPIFGTELKMFLPKNCFFEINLGYSPQKTVAGDPSWPWDPEKTSGELTIVPLALTLGHDFQLMPKLWGSAGLTAGYTWATVAIDTQAVDYPEPRYNSHTVGRGGDHFLGLMAGFILKLHRNLDVSVNLGYRYGNIKQLIVKESGDAGRIGSILSYYDESLNVEKPIPLEISNTIFYYTLKYHF
jgi:hypothetical protein